MTTPIYVTVKAKVTIERLDRAGIKEHIDELRALWEACEVTCPDFDPASTVYQIYVAQTEFGIVGVGCLVNGRGPGWTMRADAVKPNYRGNRIHQRLISARIAHARKQSTKRVLITAEVASAIAAHNYIGKGFRLDPRSTGIRDGVLYSHLVFKGAISEG